MENFFNYENIDFQIDINSPFQLDMQIFTGLKQNIMFQKFLIFTETFSNFNQNSKKEDFINLHKKIDKNKLF